MRKLQGCVDDILGAKSFMPINVTRQVKNNLLKVKVENLKMQKLNFKV